jgi:RNA polymerase sigma factor for flagellar operon FliA
MNNSRSESMAQGAENLVAEYLRNGNQIIKDKIVREYAPLIKYLVGRINVAPNGMLRREDLYQYGIIGLLEALERFKPEYQVTFKTFATKRINGKIIDALRKEGFISRDKLEKVKRIEKARHELGNTLGQEPDEYDICTHLGISSDEYHVAMNASQMNYMISLDTKVYDSEGDFIYKVDTIEDKSQLSPEENLVRDNMKTHVKKVIQDLPEKQRLVLALYFYEELTLFDIGQVLDLTEARVSQILNETLVQIRSTLQ